MIQPEHNIITYHKLNSKNCTKFNQFYKGYSDHQRAIMCIKLINNGCPRDRAIKYCSKGFCKIDITKKYEGPEGYQILKKIPEQNMAVDGWQINMPNFDLGENYQQFSEQFIDPQASEEQKVLEKHIRSKSSIQQVLKDKADKSKQYYQQLDQQFGFSNQDKFNPQFLETIRDLNDKAREKANLPRKFFKINKMRLYNLGESVFESSQGFSGQHNAIKLFKLFNSNLDVDNLKIEQEDGFDDHEQVLDEDLKNQFLDVQNRYHESFIKNQQQFEQNQKELVHKFRSGQMKKTQVNRQSCINLNTFFPKHSLLSQLQEQNSFLSNIVQIEKVEDEQVNLRLLTPKEFQKYEKQQKQEKIQRFNFFNDPLNELRKQFMTPQERIAEEQVSQIASQRDSVVKPDEDSEVVLMQNLSKNQKIIIEQEFNKSKYVSFVQQKDAAQRKAELQKKKQEQQELQLRRQKTLQDYLNTLSNQNPQKRLTKKYYQVQGPGDVVAFEDDQIPQSTKENQNQKEFFRYSMNPPKTTQHRYSSSVGFFKDPNLSSYKNNINNNDEEIDLQQNQQEDENQNLQQNDLQEQNDNQQQPSLSNQPRESVTSSQSKYLRPLQQKKSLQKYKGKINSKQPRLAQVNQEPLFIYEDQKTFNENISNYFHYVVEKLHFFDPIIAQKIDNQEIENMRQIRINEMKRFQQKMTKPTLNMTERSQLKKTSMIFERSTAHKLTLKRIQQENQDKINLQMQKNQMLNQNSGQNGEGKPKRKFKQMLIPNLSSGQVSPSSILKKQDGKKFSQYQSTITMLPNSPTNNNNKQRQNSYSSNRDSDQKSISSNQSKMSKVKFQIELADLKQNIGKENKNDKKNFSLQIQNIEEYGKSQQNNIKNLKLTLDKNDNNKNIPEIIISPTSTFKQMNQNLIQKNTESSKQNFNTKSSKQLFTQTFFN